MNVKNLIHSIVDEHHGYLRTALPATTALVQRVARTHGGDHPELHEVARRFECLGARLMDHMVAEEGELFPYIGAAAEAAGSGHRLPRSPVRSLDSALRLLEEEHEDIIRAISKIRLLTRGFAAPHDAGAVYRHCMNELADFERELETVFHLEGEVLFREARGLTAA